MLGSKYPRTLRTTLFFSIALSLLLALPNCTKSDLAQSDAAESISLVNTETIAILGGNYTSELWLNRKGGPPLYWQYVKGREASKGVVVYVLPYTGLDWSLEAPDLDFSGRAQATTGFWAEDIYGPSYSTGSTKPIFYTLIPRNLLPAAGSGFIFNNYDVLFLHHRFYAGRNANNYVDDLSRALDWVRATLPGKQIGIYGLSLGGYISLHALSNRSDSQIKSLVAVSPLVDWNQQVTFLDSASGLYTNQTKAALLADFFEPYRRRFANNASNTLGEPTVSVPTLLTHDDWDILVPVAQAERLKTRNSEKVTFLRFHKSTSINYDSMKMDHSQDGGGMKEYNVMPFALAFTFNRVSSDGDVKYLLYRKSEMDPFFTEMATARGQAKDLSGFKAALKEVCYTKYYMYEIQSAEAASLAPDYLAVNINARFGTTFTSSNVCTEIDGL